MDCTLARVILAPPFPLPNHPKLNIADDLRGVITIADPASTYILMTDISMPNKF